MTEKLLSADLERLQHIPKSLLKSTVLGLLLCILFGPVGLLYASFWGGVCMILFGIVVISSQFLFPIILLWLICCAWSVKAIERHQLKMIRLLFAKE